MGCTVVQMFFCYFSLQEHVCAPGCEHVLLCVCVCVFIHSTMNEQYSDFLLAVAPNACGLLSSHPKGTLPYQQLFQRNHLNGSHLKMMLSYQHAPAHLLHTSCSQDLLFEIWIASLGKASSSNHDYPVCKLIPDIC